MSLYVEQHARDYSTGIVCLHCGLTASRNKPLFDMKIRFVDGCCGQLDLTVAVHYQCVLAVFDAAHSRAIRTQAPKGRQ